MNLQRTHTIERQLRSGKVHFCGQPAEFAPFFMTRLAALAPSVIRGKLQLDAQVVTELTRPTATTDRGLDIGQLAGADPHHQKAGMPLLFGDRKEENPAEFDRWLTRLASVPLSDRPARAFAHITHIASWLEHERSADHLETVGIVSLEQFVEERLWGEISVVTADGLPERLFHSPHEFVSTVLKHWGRGASEGNVSHLRACARVWLELRAAQLPVPRRLHGLGPLVTREDSVALYSRLAQACGGVPSAKQIADEVERLLYGATRKGTATGPKSANQRLRLQVARLEEYVAKAPCEDPLLSALLRELFEEAKPAVAQKTPPRKPRNLPVFRHGEPCPFTFSERNEPNGGSVLEIEVSPLPDPMTQLALERIPDLRKRPKEERWLVHEKADGGFVVTLGLNMQVARANHQRGQAYGWAIKLCGLMHAPLPVRETVPNPEESR